MKVIADDCSDQTTTQPLPVHSQSDNGRLGMLSIVLGGLIALTFLSWNYLGRKTDFENAATLGAETTTVMASVAGIRIHCTDSRDSAQCIDGAKARGAEHSALWLGNSQVHAVNQWHEGELNAAPILFERLKRDDLDLVTFSQPNADLEEHLVLFEYLQGQLPIQLLILPAVFDDTREEGLRTEVRAFLEDARTKAALAETAIGSKILRKNEAAASDTGGDTAGIANTLQDRVERAVNTWLDAHSPLWSARPEIRGRLMISLYLWRNSLLGITPTSKRKVIRGRYLDNLAALAAILASAARHDVTVLLYIAPIRSDVPLPYVESEYQAFKREVQTLASRHGATFANLEDLVPSELWGSKAATSFNGEGELDFMHFQAGGHKLLADRLADLVTQARSTAQARR